MHISLRYAIGSLRLCKVGGTPLQACKACVFNVRQRYENVKIPVGGGMANRKKTALELKLSQARAGRIADRMAEESGTTTQESEVKKTLEPFALERFKTAIQKYHATWQSRIVPGQAVLNWSFGNPYGPDRFGWNMDKWLTIAKKSAEKWKIREDPERRTQCHRFLADLESTSGEFYMDPQLAEIGPWFDLFTGGPYWELYDCELLDVVDAIAWRLPDRSYEVTE